MDIDALLLAHEPEIRLTLFGAVFVLVATWEAVAPRRARALPRRLRWTHNLALVAMNTALLRLVLPLAGAGLAAFCAARGWGLLNHLQVPWALAVLVAVIALDFVIWLQHVVVHAVPVLWRLHRVHHADLDYDVTTGSRFHPLEIGLSM